ncbi:MAG: DUF4442 domain-containing protein [Gammaproteobacteria bacterium]|nr:DUF4442 domain-containing protein [Gammaproteobacteria bacterium]
MSLQHMTEESIAFVHRAGLRLLAAEPGHARCLMPLAGNENHLGSLYAGAQFTLADITGGALALASFDAGRYYPILKRLSLEFLKPALNPPRSWRQACAPVARACPGPGCSRGSADGPLARA